jgi:hypothetical protein
LSKIAIKRRNDMPVELEIHDGNPWWLSPDIWAVPGNDPEGTPGLPVAGQSCYLWARVTNNGISSINNAEVRFYWANPSAGFDRNTANLVGTSNVNLLSGQSADVLCLTPWIPEYLNNGHECVLAEAFHSSLDPLPATPDFNVPSDRHVAQLNLSVVQAVQGFFTQPITLNNTWRAENRFQIKAYQGKINQLKPFAQRFRIELSESEGKLVNAAFVDHKRPTEGEFGNLDNRALELSIPGKGTRFKSLVGRVEGKNTLVHVGQYRKGQLVGGISMLVVG